MEQRSPEQIVKEKCQEIPSWFLPNEIIVEKWIESLKEQSQSSSSLRDALVSIKSFCSNKWWQSFKDIEKICDEALLTANNTQDKKEE